MIGNVLTKFEKKSVERILFQGNDLKTFFDTDLVPQKLAE